MNAISTINLILAIATLVAVLYTLAKARGTSNCEVLVGDVLVVITYLLTLHTEWMNKHTTWSFLVGDQVWHLFGLVVLVNLMVHTIMSAKDKKGEPDVD